MVASQLRKFSVYLENGISYTFGASNEKRIEPQAFLYRCSFIGLLTNGMIKIDKRIEFRESHDFQSSGELERSRIF